MTLTDHKKVIALTLPGIVGLLILAYDYCCPGLVRIPNELNLILGRIFAACFMGGAVSSVFALTFLHSKWDALDGIFKTMFMVLNLGWLGAIVYIALKVHWLPLQH
jgi:hypothetical protein